MAEVQPVESTPPAIQTHNLSYVYRLCPSSFLQSASKAILCKINRVTALLVVTLKHFKQGNFTWLYAENETQKLPQTESLPLTFYHKGLTLLAQLAFSLSHRAWWRWQRRSNMHIHVLNVPESHKDSVRNSTATRNGWTGHLICF